MPATDSLLHVVMPAFNEGTAIASVLDEWLAVLDREWPRHIVTVLDDGSRDDTAGQAARRAATSRGRLRVRTHPNRGHGRTCRAGYEAALAEGADWIFQIDSDGQCDPADFPAFVEGTAEGFDCLFGYRMHRRDPWKRRVVSLGCSLGCSLATGRWLGDPNVPFRLVRRDKLERALRDVPPEFDLQNIALTLALRRLPDARCKSIPIRFRTRYGGIASHGNLPDLVRKGGRLLLDLRKL